MILLIEPCAWEQVVALAEEQMQRVQQAQQQEAQAQQELAAAQQQMQLMAAQVATLEESLYEARRWVESDTISELQVSLSWLVGVEHLLLALK